MVFAFRAKTKSFDFPICVSLQASTENVLNITQNTQLGKGRQGMENFSPKGIFFGGEGCCGGGWWRQQGRRRAERVTPTPERHSDSSPREA